MTERLLIGLGLLTLGTGAAPLPVPITWQMNAKTLTRRQYIKDIDYLKANTAVDVLAVAPVEDTVQDDLAQMREPLKELVEHAHAKGFRVVVRTGVGTPGFFAAPAFPSKYGLTVKGPLPNIIKDQEGAQALTVDVEGKLDGEGYACLRSEAKWNREKMIPLYAKPLAAYVFEKTGAGFYKPGSLVDVSGKMRVVAQDNRSMSVELDLGAAFAGRDVFLLAGHFFNSHEIYEAQYADFRRTFDGLAEVGLNGVANDEKGFMSVDAWGVEAFRGRYFSFAGERYWRETLKTDFRRLLFDMRYAPAGEPAVRIRAINRYFDEARRVTMAFEDAVVDYQLKHHRDVFLSCHSTYHNSLESDDIIKNTCNYWSIPRDYGFTDEGTLWPIRLGVLLGSKMKFGYNMYYSKNPADVYANIVACAPWKIREFHHAYNDGKWGLGYTEQPFTANVKKLDAAVHLLDDFQRDCLPRTDVLMVFGEFAHANWYPDEKARGKWDQNGSLQIMEKAQEVWSAGHVAALVPDRLIEEGRLRFEDGVFKLFPIARKTACDVGAGTERTRQKVGEGTERTRQKGVVFRKVIYLYPRYAKKCVWDFLNGAAAKGAELAVVGPADLDFDGAKAAFAGRHYATWNLARIAADLKLAKSRVPGGCVYEDGSFAFVSDAVLTGKPTPVDFTLDGAHFTGHHTGVLAFRKGTPLVMTPGGALWCNGKGVVASGLARAAVPPPPAEDAQDWDGVGTALAAMGGAEEIVYCVRPLCQSHLMYATFGENADEWAREVYPELGSSIRAFNLRTKTERVLLDDPRGNIRDVKTSYDGKKLVFAWRHVPETATNHAERIKHVYHLFEMNADGTGVRQITDGPDDDFDAIYLPDGGFLFGSGRCRRFIPCNRVRTSTLYRCDANGKNVLPLTSNVLLEDRPAVLPDGRIVYTRWDYVDRATETFRDLWVMNPDGSNQQLLWGGSDAARAYGQFHANCDARPVPGRRQVVCTFSPAFGYRENAGKLYLVDLDKGPDSDAAKHPIGPDVSKEIGWGIGNGGERMMKGFRDPYPLTDDCFFVCRGRQVQLVNRAGACVRVLETPDGAGLPHDAAPLVGRVREPALASRLDLAKTNGVFVLANVYEARNMKGVKPGTIKKLLIMEDLPKSASRHGPRGAHGGHISLHRILGEVPVEADGSAAFEVPALRAVMFAALDKKGIAVKRMQNFTQAMPGEVQGCVGCHETRTDAGASARVLRERAGSLTAMKRAPSVPRRPEGVPEVYVYTRDVQPVLDRNCVRCHSTEKAAGHVILSGDLTEWRSMSYDMLYAHLQISRATGWKENGNHGSYGFGTGASALMNKLDGSHHGVKVSPRDWDVVRLWVESSAHYSGTYGTHNHFESQVGATKNATYRENGNVGGDWWFKSFDRPKLADELEAVAQRKCYSCHGNMYGLGRLRREQRDCNRWTPQGCPPDWLNSPNYSFTLFNMTHPEKSLFLAACMPKEQGGYGWCTNAQGRAIAAFTGPEDPDYVKVRKLIAEADERQRRLGRLEHPGYRPQPYYVYWMRRFGVLPPETDLDKTPVDCYAADRAYWESLWYRPQVEGCSNREDVLK